MALSPDQIKGLSRSQAEIRRAQMHEMYRLLYPLMLRDFAHRDDISAALTRIEAFASGHTHANHLTPASPMPPAAFPLGTVAGQLLVDVANTEIISETKAVEGELKAVSNPIVQPKRNPVPDEPIDDSPLPLSTG